MPGKSSIGFSGFEKLTFLIEILKIFEISKISKNFERGAPALRVIRAGTRLTVHRSLSRDLPAWRVIPNRGELASPWPREDSWVIFYIMSYWFVTFRCFILYWSSIFCEYQLPSSTKPLLTTALPPRQNVEKMMKFSNFDENSYQKLLDLEIYIWEAPHENNFEKEL